mgnify:CR=1 FL=1
MKLTFLLLLSFVFALSVSAQRCLNMSVLSLMSKLEIPGNAAKNFEACNKTTNEHQQLVIADYGNYMKDLDTLVAQKERDFNNAVIEAAGSTASQMPSTQTVQDSKQLAEVLQSMTPEQQKEWAMQQANERRASSGSHAAMQDNPAVIRLVMETYNIAASQLPAVDREFAAAYRGIESERSNAIEKIPQADRSKCKSADNFGNPSCSCVNGLAAKSFNQKLIAQEKYDAQKIALYQSYIVKIKGLVQQVDQNIAKLHYGAEIKSKQYQKMLFSSQSAAFGNAFDFTYLTIKAIHQDDADLYVNKVNSEKGFYDLSCVR